MLTFEDASEKFGGAGDMDLDNPGEVHSADTDDTAETMETHVFGKHTKTFPKKMSQLQNTRHTRHPSLLWLISDRFGGFHRISY